MGQGVGSPAFRVEAMPTKGDRGLRAELIRGFSDLSNVLFLMLDYGHRCLMYHSLYFSVGLKYFNTMNEHKLSVC